MDHEAAEEAANLPGIAMMVIGGLNGLFWLLFTGLGILGLIGSLMVSVAAILSSFESGDMGTAVFYLWTTLISVCGSCTNVIGLLGSALVIFGGLKMRSLSGKSMVNLGIFALVGVPLLSIVVGVLSSLASFACCSLVFGQLPTVVLLVFNGAIAAWAFMTLSNEDVAAAFEANDGDS